MTHQMNTWKRIGLVGVLLGASLVVGNSNAGIIEIKHNTTTGLISKEAVVVIDDDSNSSYLAAPTPALTNYIEGNLKNKSINSQNTEIVKTYLGADSVPAGRWFISFCENFLTKVSDYFCMHPTDRKKPFFDADRTYHQHHCAGFSCDLGTEFL